MCEIYLLYTLSHVDSIHAVKVNTFSLQHQTGSSIAPGRRPPYRKVA